MRTEAEIRGRLDRVWLDIGGYMLRLDQSDTATDVITSGQGLFAAGIISEVLEWVLGGPDHAYDHTMQAQNEREGE